ncbi:MAG: EAL domain-containing protein, partial [Hyphomicrobiaceae bacterium]
RTHELGRASASGASIAKTELVSAAALVPLPEIDRVAAAELDDSVAALHAAADAMREAGRSMERPTLEKSVPSRHTIAPPPLPKIVRQNDPARSRLAAVADALDRERFDIMLEPILGLGDRRAQHYVVSVRLCDGLGDSSSGFGIERTAPGSGLLPLLDAVKVEGAARVAWRMEDRAKSGALFSQLAGESLVSDRFLNRFADTYRQGETLSGRLVLSFRQVELRTFSELQWSTLRDMADLGFRFCLDDITTLDLDFAALATAGFTFARLDADTFIEGLPIDAGIIPAADICRHFAGVGLAVIVAGIADEAVARQLQNYGVELGHGGLFGGARPVKADVLRNPHAAVA